MRDISGTKFEVGDTLKVMKGSETLGVGVGSVWKCVKDDGSPLCLFENSYGRQVYYANSFLQKL